MNNSEHRGPGSFAIGRRLLALSWPIAFVSAFDQDGADPKLGHFVQLWDVSSDPAVLRGELSLPAEAVDAVVDDAAAYIAHRDGVVVVSPPCGGP